jgi:hypothetical protein
MTASAAVPTAQPPPAAAVPTTPGNATDDAFLAALTANRIQFVSPSKAFIAAHEVCAELDNGKTPTQVASNVMSGSDLDGYHAGFFVGASIRAYCPQYVDARN